MMHEKNIAGQQAAPAEPRAMLPNVSAMLETAHYIINRPGYIDGIAVAYGPSGYGKSVASTVTAIRTNAAYVECKKSWDQRDLIDYIAREFGVPGRNKVSRTIEAICEEMARSRRLLILDEADHVVKKGHIELIREIYMDSNKGPILLVGEEYIGTKLEPFERFHNRVTKWLPFEPATVDDARTLAALYCRDVRFTDDLLDLIIRACDFRLRRIVNNLEHVRSEAVKLGEDVASLDWWGDRELFTGATPSRGVAPAVGRRGR